MPDPVANASRVRRACPALWGPPAFVCLLSVYTVTHLCLRLLVSPVLTIDDSREAVFGQTLAWGYQPWQPPLYNWLVWGAFRLFGVGVHSLTLVKYAVLFLAYWLVYASGRRILSDTRLATLGAFSLLLILPISWIPHEALTHSIAVLAASAATFYALLRLEASGSLSAYLGLGLALGGGLLSKFTYAVFAAALLAAALTVERFRSRLLHPRMLLTLGLAGALILPYALWFTQKGFVFLRMYAEQVRAGSGATYLEGVAAGLYYIARVTFYYLTPLWIVLRVVFPEVYRPRPRVSGEAGTAGGTLLERFVLTVLGILVAGALMTGVAYLKFRWMIPVFFLFPLYAFWRLDRAGCGDRGIRRFAVILLVAEVGIVGGILLRVGSGSLFERPYKLNEPYDVLGAEIAAAGFSTGTIVGGTGPIAGNLRLTFPDSRVISLESPYYLPPAPGHGQCLIVWEKGGEGAVPSDIRALMASALEVNLTGAEPIRLVEARYRFAPDHVRRVHYVLLGNGAGLCR